MGNKKYLQYSSYKLMFVLGIVDMFSLIASGVFSSYFQLNGYIYCSAPVWNFIAGALAIGAWVGNNAIILLLVFNRCLEFSYPDVSQKLFAGNKTYLWIICFPVPMMIWGFFFAQPPIFSASINTYAYYPYPGIFTSNMTDFSNDAMLFNNYVVCGLQFLVYVVFFILFGYKYVFNPNKSAQTKSVTTQLFLQALVICFLTLTTDVIYVSMSHFTFPAFFNIVAHLDYLISSGVTGVIYLLMNKTLKGTIRGWFKYKVVKVSPTNTKKQLSQFQIKKKNTPIVKAKKTLIEKKVIDKKVSDKKPIAIKKATSIAKRVVGNKVLAVKKAIEKKPKIVKRFIEKVLVSKKPSQRRSIADVNDLIINLILGTFIMTGTDYFEYPTLMVVVCNLANGTWTFVLATSNLMACERILIMTSSNKAQLLFEGNNTWVFILLSLASGLFVMFFGPMFVLSPYTGSFILNPYTGYNYTTNIQYNSIYQIIVNIGGSGLLILMYGIFFIFYFKSLSKRVESPLWADPIALRMFIQTLLICVFAIISGVMFVAENYFYISKTTTVIGHVLYLNMHGFVGICYLLINTTLKNTIKQKLNCGSKKIKSTIKSAHNTLHR
uniref:7TM_GPCR_Srx domain-containing protein n=1 Tax=Rhabditophanes sp. KR3021 TaxID=114890 RepID=A0AC35TFM8_9BILA